MLCVYIYINNIYIYVCIRVYNISLFSKNFAVTKWDFLGGPMVEQTCRWPEFHKGLHKLLIYRLISLHTNIATLVGPSCKLFLIEIGWLRDDFQLTFFWIISGFGTDVGIYSHNMNIHTGDGSEIRRSPVEVGSLSHTLQGFIHPR